MQHARSQLAREASIAYTAWHGDRLRHARHPREAHVNITWRWPTDAKRRPRQVVAQCALLGAERPINDATPHCKTLVTQPDAMAPMCVRGWLLSPLFYFLTDAHARHPALVEKRPFDHPPDPPGRWVSLGWGRGPRLCALPCERSARTALK
jgi:hypothetical protein